MTASQQEDVRRVALHALDLMQTRLRPFERLVASAVEHFDPIYRPSPEEVLDMILGEQGHALRSQLHTMLATWDYDVAPEWAEGTQAYTQARRSRIYDVLELGHEHREVLSSLFPPFPRLDPIVTINEETGWLPWYHGARRRERACYWPRYQRYLKDARGWSPQNLALLDQSSTDVVARLCDPESEGARAVRGLVVGYVQSGKTANFSAVIAKAGDAGYRLFIVLAGTLNSLREQTQRRLDKELLGKDFAEEYSADPDWDEFPSFPRGLPAMRGGFDWERLTTKQYDFQALVTSVGALRYQKLDTARSFRDPVNLHRTPARLIVVKKNRTPLTNLIDALRRSSTLVPWSEVPTMVIDDESDQASLNTLRPTINEERERTAINGLIVELLQVLANAQYVGYTATPFANVFVDPDDPQDLFPADFLLSLPRPQDYMGPEDFVSSSVPTPPGKPPTWHPLVRDVVGDDGEDSNLPAAVDAFVLSGAVKLYREAHSALRFKHHTMLVHNSPRVLVHAEDARHVADLFFEANYAGGGSGMARLRRLWEDDFAYVCRNATATALDYHTPGDFSEIAPFVGGAVQRVLAGDQGPTIILNGTETENAPDFDRSSVWKIICGGAKLSRGYTVEGLTVSYYRRRAGAADTLMQMGRWFGYRFGYRDLVRLYIGRAEGPQATDLYEAFRGVCYDEEEFREQLARYARLDGDQRITPRQIPPLVPSHYLRPSSSNKMYNAKLAYENYGGQHIQRTQVAVDELGRRNNLQLLGRLLQNQKVQEHEVDIGGKRMSFSTGSTSSELAYIFLSEFSWLGDRAPDRWRLVLEFLRGERVDPGIRSWLVLLPQMSEGAIRCPLPECDLTLPVRRRGMSADESRFLVLSEPGHIEIANWLAGLNSAVTSTPEGLRSEPGTAVIVPYLVIPKRVDAEHLGGWTTLPATGFALVLPANSSPRKVGWTVRDSAHPHAVVIEAN